MLLLKTNTEKVNFDTTHPLPRLIMNITADVFKQINEKPKWASFLFTRIGSENSFLEKLESKDYGRALFQTLEFFNDILIEKINYDEYSKDSSTPTVRKRITSISSQLSEAVKLTKLTTNSLAFRNRQLIEL